jgi:hypothetical protein
MTSFLPGDTSGIEHRSVMAGITNFLGAYDTLATLDNDYPPCAAVDENLNPINLKIIHPTEMAYSTFTFGREHLNLSCMSLISSGFKR